MNKNYLSIAVIALLNTSQASISIHKYRPPKGREPWAKESEERDDEKF